MRIFKKGEGMKEIKLSRGLVTLVDDADYDWLNQWKWCAVRSRNDAPVYAKRIDLSNGGRKKITMHRLITDCPKGMYVDHIDGNGLNNQRSNLRICTNAENVRNKQKPPRGTSGYYGVTHVSKNSWRASITANYHRIDLGCYATPEKAAQAYNDAAVEMHKEFAVLNKLKVTHGNHR